jgi:hypothetical protein
MLQREVQALYLLFPLAQLIRLYVLQREVQTLYLLFPLAQLIRLCIANRSANLVFASLSRSIRYITGWQWSHQAHICELLSYLWASPLSSRGLGWVSAGLGWVSAAMWDTHKFLHVGDQVKSTAVPWVCMPYMCGGLPTQPYSNTVLLQTGTQCCKGRSKPCDCYSLSLNRLDYVLQREVQALYLLLPLAQLIRLCVAKGGPSLVFVIPSRSID